MPNWNWSSVEMRASSGASSTVWGNSPGLSLANAPTPPARSGTSPTTPRPGTTRQLVDTIYQLAGQPKTKLRSTPVLLLRALGVTNPTVRELLELQYEFQEPFIVDSTKIAAKLNVNATPLDQALADTLATYRTNPS